MSNTNEYWTEPGLRAKHIAWNSLKALLTASVAYVGVGVAMGAATPWHVSYPVLALLVIGLPLMQWGRIAWGTGIRIEEAQIVFLRGPVEKMRILRGDLQSVTCKKGALGLKYLLAGRPRLKLVTRDGFSDATWNALGDALQNIASPPNDARNVIDPSSLPESRPILPEPSRDRSRSEPDRVSWMILPWWQTLVSAAFLVFALLMIFSAFVTPLNPKSPVPRPVGVIAVFAALYLSKTVFAGGCTLDFNKQQLTRWGIGVGIPRPIPFSEFLEVRISGGTASKINGRVWYYVKIRTDKIWFDARAFTKADAAWAFANSLAKELSLPLSDTRAKAEPTA